MPYLHTQEKRKKNKNPHHHSSTVLLTYIQKKKKYEQRLIFQLLAEFISETRVGGTVSLQWKNMN